VLELASELVEDREQDRLGVKGKAEIKVRGVQVESCLVRFSERCDGERAASGKDELSADGMMVARIELRMRAIRKLARRSVDGGRLVQNPIAPSWKALRIVSPLLPLTHPLRPERKDLERRRKSDGCFVVVLEDLPEGPFGGELIAF
jgi:hypothetical protein